MTGSPNTTTRAIFGTISLFILFFIGLGAYPLLDPDEPVYGQVAKEMVRSGGWLTPHYNGHFWFDKPPLHYWLSAASMKVFGVNELAARLPSAIMAVLVVLLVYLLASHDFGKRVGIFAAIVMATCLQQIILARAAVTDMTFVFCLIFALYSYRRWLTSESTLWAALCGVATGLGMLTKGPVAPLLLSVTFVIHLYWTRKLSRLKSLDTLVAVAAVLIVGLPWFAAMYHLHRVDFVNDFIIKNNFQRFLRPEHAKVTGHWYSYFMNIPILFVFFFPWSVFLIQSIRKCARINDGTKLAIVWSVIVFGFFSLSKTQLVTYIFPLYPAIAVLVGVFLEAASVRDIHKPLYAGLGASIALAAGLIQTVHHLKYHDAEKSVMILSILLPLTFLIAIIRMRRPNDVVKIIGVGMMVFTLWMTFGIGPFIGKYVSMKDITRSIPNSPAVRIIQFDAEKPSFLFYSDRQPEQISDPAKVKDLLAEEQPICVIAKKKRANILSAPGLTEIEKGDFVIIENQAATKL